MAILFPGGKGLVRMGETIPCAVSFEFDRMMSDYALEISAERGTLKAFHRIPGHH
jgi:hypothetical protein